MKAIGVQMIDQRISADWWKAVMKYFAKENDKLQIRCWNEELEEIEEALKYGASHIEGNETCIDGTVNKGFLAELIHSPEPEDKSIYNKMTKYFTIRVTDGVKIIESAHYGTEMYLEIASEDANQFYEIMEPYKAGLCMSDNEM